MRLLGLAFLCCTVGGVLGCGTALTGDSDGGGSGNDAAVPLSDGGQPDLLTGPACGNTHCNVGEVCELGACHKDCGMSIRCGQPETCCNGGDVCYLGACTTPGAPCTGMGGSDGGSCATTACPMGQYCDQSIGHCLPLAMTNMCEYHPPIGMFNPVVKWEWQGSAVAPAYNQVMMAPMVADLDGDCMPDVVFTTFTGGNYTTDGIIRAVRGDGKGALFDVTDAALRAIPGAQVALADVDGDGKIEIFACHQSKALMALNSDGTKKWISNDTPCGSFDAPSVADLDHDGTPEVFVGAAVHNALNGALKGNPPALPTYGNYGSYTTAAELDANPGNGMEIVAGGIVYHMDGTLYWDKSGGNTGYAAIGDLDGDGSPDVVSVAPGVHTVTAYKHDGTVIWGPVDVNNGVPTPQGANGGGPPTIADFDGNGKPDVAAAGGYGYLVLDGQTGKPLWQSTMTTDTSSRVTGSSVFDFEGDGVAEAIYNDEHNLRVYRGTDGMVEIKLCSTSGTLWENPVIVDVDGDDHAEIVVMDNNYAINTCDDGSPSHTGFKVIGDAKNNWVRTRRLWNQHTYHVTNVGDDGKIPQLEANNWQQPGLNDFRQNVQTKNVFAAPDLVPKDLHPLYDKCANNQITLVATVLNQGAAGVPAGVPVTFYWIDMNGQSQVAGTVMTAGQILPGASEVVSLVWTPMSDPKGPITVLVVVDDAGAPNSGIVNECDETNNSSAPLAVGCPQIG